MRIEILQHWLDATCGPVSVRINTVSPDTWYCALHAQIASQSRDFGANYFVGSLHSEGEPRDEVEAAANALALLCEATREVS